MTCCFALRLDSTWRVGRLSTSAPQRQNYTCDCAYRQQDRRQIHIYICICTWSLEISCKPRKLHIMYVRGVCGPQKHKPESSGGHCGTAQTDGVPTSSRYILRQICLLHVVGAYIFIEPEIRMATLIRLIVCI